MRAARFDTAQKTAWSAEGLLGYLPPDAQDRLFDTITELGAQGSRVATESTPNPEPSRDDKTREHLRQPSARWSAHGFNPEIPRTAVNSDPRIAPGFRGVAEPITSPTWQLFGDDRIIRVVCRAELPALVFADDRGREGA